ALDLGQKGRDDYFGSGLIQMDRALDAAVSSRVKILPVTGFSPRSIDLPEQPIEQSYTSFDLVLEIPSIKLNTGIVGVPEQNTDWNLTWLGKNAGWLEGSAFPTWQGNSVITGHVWNADNSPGPFFGIKKLRYDDLIKIEAWGQVYTYQVRSNVLVSPENSGSAFQHEEGSWITLITCENYDQTADTYLNRRIVKAVLVEVRSN
ncbi:MAG: sortase, partial [Chloroflexota bacterium]